MGCYSCSDTTTFGQHRVGTGCRAQMLHRAHWRTYPREDVAPTPLRNTPYSFVSFFAYKLKNTCCSLTHNTPPFQQLPSSSVFDMTSSSSSSSSFDVVCGPRENDVLWMQKQHVSQHIWNEDADRKLRMRRAIPTYQGIEQPPTEIIPLLQQSGLYTTIKLRRIKINGGIVNVFVERWRPETHTFHLTCGEATITLQDVSVLLGLPVDDNPLIGSTNIDEIDMFKPNANALAGENTSKLSWLASEFANIQDYVDDEEHLKMFACA
ncbi:Serine/threonine-protein phosphatase 7 long form [Glycine max]|nr:Serine/threonine-protein phosphatase 7 long form [Glycine max]